MISMSELLLRTAEMHENLRARNIHIDLGLLANYHAAHLNARSALEALQARSNRLTKTLAHLNADDREAGLAEANVLKNSIAEARKLSDAASARYFDLLKALPNWKSPDVPNGKTDADNAIIRSWGKPAELLFSARDHVAIGEALGLIDFPSGRKVSGSKCYFLRNEAVILQHALKNYVFRLLIEEGFIPLSTPDFAYDHILEGVGFSPRGLESNTYRLEGLDKSLIATAEICVGGMHSNETIGFDRLPLCYVAESHCFRREAGAAGQSSKGLYRVHQFEKIELFVICEPGQSEQQHDRILSIQEKIYQGLGIPYRVVVNCSGDLGAPAYKKYDIEAWMPGKGAGEYGEVTSASNCTDYQARRLGIRYRPADNAKPRYVHTLNGTALALGRTMVAIMENFQQPDGSFMVPEALRAYMGREFIGRD